MFEQFVDEERGRIVFGGPSGKLTVAFDLATLPEGSKEELWPTATVAFDAPGLRALAKVTFFPHDLGPFVRALASAHTTLSGRAKIESEDGDFSLVVEYANGGDVSVSGLLQPSIESGSAVTYRIDTDQSYLAAVVSDLRALLP